MPKKRGNGETMYRQRSDGRWEARVSLGHENGKRKRVSYYGKTKKEVIEKVAEAKAKHLKGLPVVVNTPTMEAFLLSWLRDVVKQRTRPSTFRSYEQITRNHLIPAIGKTRVDRLTAMQVTQFYNDRHNKGISAEHLHRVLRSALNQAMKWDLVSRNVATLAAVPRRKAKEMSFLDDDQADLFFAALRGHPQETLFTVAIATGLRLGELLGLRWQDIDFCEKTLHVSVQMQRVDGKMRAVELKSQNGDRVIALPNFVLESLQRHKESQAEIRILNSDRWIDNGLVFCSSIGTPADPRNLTRVKDALLERAGLPRIRFHDLRHTTATLLARMGTPARYIMGVMGHSQVQQTMRYTHVVKKAGHEVAERFDERFANSVAR